MENLGVSWILEEMANLLELKRENPFKIAAYRKGAHIIASLHEPLPSFIAKERLLHIPGIGKALARDIEEIIREGTCPLYEDLLQEIPRGLVEMLQIPGLGPWKILLFYQELGISNLSQLKEAAKRKRLRLLKGIGSKTEAQILMNIDIYQRGAHKILLEMAMRTGQLLLQKLQGDIRICNSSLVGGVRRREELVDNIEILISSFEVEELRNDLAQLPGLKEMVVRENGVLEITLREGLVALIMVVLPKDFSYQKHLHTGSSAHLSQLRAFGEKKGIFFQKEGLFREEKKVELNSEEEIYSILDLPFIIPELRQGEREIEAATFGHLPDSVNPSDIKGDLHVHTSWSDGGHTLEEMVFRGMERGYEYLAICDHSPSLKIARGLSMERLKEQMRHIDKIKESLAPFTIFKGVEVDILRDGSLDLPDEILSQLDVVVASIHTGLREDPKTQTRRIIKAIENPYVHIIGHLQGRLLGHREPYQLDFQEIFLAAHQCQKVLEINVAPDRLDLRDVLMKEAALAKIKMAINTDAHSVSQLDYMDLGVSYARRGYLEKKDVINTYSRKELEGFLKSWR